MTEPQGWVLLGIFGSFVIGGFTLIAHFFDRQLKATRDIIITTIDAKIDGLDSRLNAKIDGLDSRLNSRIDGLEAKLTGRIDALDRDIQAIASRVFKPEHD